MTAAGLALHLLSFALPAFAVAALVALAGRVLLGAGRPGWWTAFVTNSVAGLAVLGAGVWYFGRDGKMATYAVLVAVVATCQWLTGRGWRR